MRSFIALIVLCLSVLSTPAYSEVQSLSQAINESGRLRMLSQRIAKLYTAIALSKDETHKVDLQQAVQEFESALNQLISSPDNTQFVRYKLNKVLTQWNFSKQGFLALEKGQSTPLVISITTESILKQMNDITALYQEIDLNKTRLAAN